MSDLTVVSPNGWEYDLHSVYSAYIGYFQLHAVPWYARSWGYIFTSFASFLAFSWPVITVTDKYTHLPHIVTRNSSVGAFIKMVKTRFGETLPQPPNILIVSPFESSPRPLRSLNSYASYKRLHATLPAMVLNALKVRIRMGDPVAVREIWGKPLSLPVSEEGPKSPRTGTKEGDTQGRDKTFLAIDFKRNDWEGSNILEWGYAVVVCGQLNALGNWPPVPEQDYRRGYYIATDHKDKVQKRQSLPVSHHTFNNGQVVSKENLPQIIQAVVSAFASPDSETTPNTLVLIAHGVSENLEHLEEMEIRIPHNVLILDTAAYERALYVGGFRGPIPDQKSSHKPRSHAKTLSLENLFRSLTAMNMEGVDRGKKLGHRVSASLRSNTTSKKLGVQENKIFEHPPTIQTQASMPLLDLTTHQAGNKAFICLLSLQALLEPTTHIPRVVKAMGSVQPTSNTEKIGFKTMTSRVLYPWAHQGVNGYQNSHMAGYILYPALMIPSYTIGTHRRHSTISPAHPNTSNSIYSTFASTGAASHPPTVSDSESHRSGHGRRASVTYDLAGELKQMQMERESSKVLG